MDKNKKQTNINNPVKKTLAHASNLPLHFSVMQHVLLVFEYLVLVK